MERIFIFCLVLASSAIFSQNPLLKIYTDGKEVDKESTPVSAFVKAHGKYHSLLKVKDKSISLPEEVEFHKIEGLKFIVKNDTIIFSISKILEDLKNNPEKNMVDELYTIFKELPKWELRIDNFKYTSKEQLLTPANEGQTRNTIYKDYKIYSLRTSNFKYYIVKGKAAL